MVEVGRHVERLGAVEIGQQFDQFVVEKADREDHRGPRADPYVIEVIDITQGVEHFGQGVGRQQQRIAARHDDVLDLGVLGDVLGRLLEAFDGLIVRQADHPLAEAMTAVHRAVLGGDDQGGVGILVQDAVTLVVLVVTVRIAGGFAHGAGQDHFIRGRNGQLADRIIRVVRIDQFQIIAGNIHRMPLGNLRQFLFFVRLQRQVLFQVGNRIDVFFELLLPVDFEPVDSCCFCRIR